MAELVVIHPGAGAKRKRIRKNKHITIATINVRGAKGKIKSLESLLTTEKIQVAIITETMFKNKEAYNIKGYKWIARNRKNQDGGGVGILVSNDVANHTTEINEIEENENLESVWIEIKTRPKNIAIGAFYGPQEKEKIEKVKDIYRGLTTQINQINKNAEIIIAGDFNAKLEITKDENRIQDESRNGKILKELMNNTGLKAMNLEKAEGLWTRVNRNNPNERSVIDYILATKQIQSLVLNTNIDETGSLRIRGKKETDHNTITMEMKINAPREKNTTTRWKLQNKEGWIKMNEEIGKSEIEKLEFEQVEKYLIQVLKATIGQITTRTDKPKKEKSERITKAKMERKERKREFEEACKSGTYEQKGKAKKAYEESQINLRREMEKHETEKTEERIAKIVRATKINPNAIWDARKRARTDNELEYDTITEEGKTLTDPNETLSYIADQYEALYQARPGLPTYQKWTEHITNTIKNLEQEHDKYATSQGSENITFKELNKAIKKLKRNKSLGPDMLPNEIFIEANKKTRMKYLEILNNLHREEQIPDSWRIGHIKRLYKGKGVKGKCSNERGITLASNFGKLYERIINERVKNIVEITDAQAGGIEGNATVDHLITLKQMVASIRNEKKTAYVIFLDVQKAYDKAWLDAILYVLNKNGLKGKNLQLVKKMNSELRAQIQTKYGLTREIKIKDSIRQGGVLSVIEYAALIDEISKELHHKDLGIKIDEENKMGCLLWMDDVALIHHDVETLQQMMECTNDVARRYHVEFGVAKCKIVRIGKGPKATIYLNDQPLEETNKYKYLGETINNKANLKDHISELKGKVAATVQKIMIETGNKEFKGIKMRAIWELVETSIIPIITYGSEGWKMTKEDICQIQSIFNGALKEILQLPQGTPTTILLTETGFLPIEMIIKKKKLNQHNRIQDKPAGKLIRRVTENPNSLWTEEIAKLCEEYEIDKTEFPMKKEPLNQLINNKNINNTTDKINEESTQKSKIEHWIKRKDNIKPGVRPEYMNRLGRKQCSAIIRVRSSMMVTKTNMPGKFNDKNCRMCKRDVQETQEHILQQCEEISKITQQIQNYEDIFKEEDIENLKTAANIIIKITEKVEERLQ